MTRRTSGCAISASTTSAASAGALVMRLTTPAGIPACSRHSTISPCVRGGLRCLHHDGVAVGERRRDRARAKDHRCVPGCDADDHAGGLAHGAHALAGDVRVDLLIDQPGLRRRLAQHPGGEPDVEHAPAERAAGLIGHDLGELGRALVQQLGAPSQDLAAPGDRCLGPILECGRGGVDRQPRVLGPAAAAAPTASPVYGKCWSYVRPSAHVRPRAADQQLLPNEFVIAISSLLSRSTREY